MKRKQVFSLILIFAILIQTVIGCATKNIEKKLTDASQEIEKSQKSQTDETKSNDDNEQQQTDHVKTEQVTLSKEKTSAEICDIKVDVGEYVLDGDEELVVTVLEQEVFEEEDRQIDVYEISIGDKSELNDFITIRMPYRTDFCDEGEDPAECVQGQYKNEETGLWETIPYSVDKENQEVVILTDHLSKFGVCYVRNAGARNAYVSIDTDSIGFNDLELDGLIEDYLESTNKSLVLQEAGATILDDLFSANDAYDKYVKGYADNLAKIFTIGEKDFGGLFNEKVSAAMEGLGYAVLALKTVNLIVNDGSDKQKLDLVSEVYSTTVTFLMKKLTSAGTAAFNSAMVAVWILGKGIEYAYNESYEMTMDKMGRVYAFYNDKFSYSPADHTARTDEDWRMEIIKIIEDNKDTPENISALIDKNIDDYLAGFWKLGDSDQHTVANEEYFSRTGHSINHRQLIINTTQAQKDKITADYKHNLLIRLVDIQESVVEYFQNKAIQEYQNMLNEVEYYFNTPIETLVYEIIDKETQTYKYPGYIVQFGPLSEDADIEAWTTGTIDENGQHKTSFTILGYLISGSPTEVYLYKPDADLSEDEPAETLQLNFSETDNKAYARIEGGLEGRFTGTYTNVGSQIELNSTKVSDTLYDKIKSLGHWTSKSQWETWLTDKFYYELGISKFIDVDKCLPNDPGNNYYDIYFTIGTVINNTSQEFHFVNTATLENDQFIIYEGNVRGTLDVTIDEEQELARITGNDLEFAFTGNELNEIVGELAMPVDYEAYYLYFDVDATKPLEAEFLELD